MWLFLYLYQLKQYVELCAGICINLLSCWVNGCCCSLQQHIFESKLQQQQFLYQAVCRLSCYVSILETSCYSYSAIHICCVSNIFESKQSAALSRFPSAGC